MTALVSYSTGTVSVAANGTTVTGVGSIWSGTNVRPGDVLQIGNFQTVISDVTDTTHLVIPPWGGGVQSGAAYKIWQVSPQRFAGAQAMQSVNDLVAALNVSGFFWFVDTGLTAPDPSYGDDGQYAYQPSTGAYWLKTGGVWVSSGSPAAGYGGTSTTSVAIGTGSKVFTTQSGLAYNGARVRAAAASDATKWMEGPATYSGTTLTIAVDKTGGSGTFASWTSSIAGQPGVGDMVAANNLSDVANAATARSNLGAGTVTSVTAGTGLTGGAITGSGTVAVDYASKSDQQTATATAKTVNPAHQQDHDSAAKAWVLFRWTGSVIIIDTQYNVASVTRTSAGIYNVNFTTPFASGVYVCQVTTEVGGSASEGILPIVLAGSKATNSVQIRFINTPPTAAVDPSSAHAVFYGRQ
ncbi:hypothetical protein [Bradyrhizobium sp. 188]|uniref:hypothetical protein n=1 Tax=Bradyrhizobium sp. 188 TaxID=2782656 RepID=UPI001FF7D09E|nr:hypothetical protein [Bradyrhizobium sp. 188]